MLDWIRKRRLSEAGRKKMMIAMARAEEALIETHVSNILDIAVTLEDEVEIDRAVEMYLDRIKLDDSLAASVTNRLLSRLDQVEPTGPRGGRASTPPRRYRHAFREPR